MTQTQVVLISGPQGSGKTTTAKLVHTKLYQHRIRTHHLTFSESIYKMHDFCRGVLREAGIDHLPGQKDGNLLQLLGTEWGRKIDENIWVKILQARVRYLEERYPGSRTVFIISDCRFPNELFAFPDALRVRLNADKETRKKRAEMWRENDRHPSEIALDGLDVAGHFDLYVDTSVGGLQPEGVASLIMHELLNNSWLEKRKV